MQNMAFMMSRKVIMGNMSFMLEIMTFLLFCPMSVINRQVGNTGGT